MISIGITGIIGSGKSMLSQVFRTMGIPVYDADTQAKVLMNSNLQIKNSLVKEFGEDTYIEGTINKDYLRKIVFGNEAKRQIVNSIVHPAVKDDFIAWRQQAGTEITAIESAILFEANIDDILDHIIFVEAPEDVIIKRICYRDKVTEEIARQKIHIQRQNSGHEKCDTFFVNDRNHSLIEQTEKFINNLKI
ncbi:MAG: dephospho-CoA kinase [Bacteroidales bacterium]|nr:dephospho-CoA kinase [Bacteroidales bacterium]